MRYVMVAFLLALPCLARADVLFNVGCSSSDLRRGLACNFANNGDSTGRACATVTLTNASGDSTTSMPVCSGMVDAGQAVTVSEIVFTGAQPLMLCSTTNQCSLGVKLTKIEAAGSPLAMLWLLPVLLVIASTIWMFFDAKQLGESTPPTVMLDTQPWAWLIGAFLLWIVVFPVYLAQRAKWRRAIDAAKRIQSDAIVSR